MGPPPSLRYQRQLRNCSMDSKPYLASTSFVMASLVGLVPEIVLGPFAGAYVDRWNRRAVMIVADGFAGNVAIKTAEGTASMILTLLRREIKARPLAMLGALLAKPAFSAAGRVLDYREYGGAPLLGVDGVVIVGHGRSDARAIRNGIRLAAQAVENGVLEAIKQGLAEHER